jgi:hypothetical protein
VKSLAPVCCLAIVLAMVDLSDAKRPAAPRSKTRELGQVTYDFNPIRKWPRWNTARMTIRNEKKLRPLFFSGRHDDGKLIVKFAQAQEGLDTFMGDPNAAALLGSTHTSGTAEILMDNRTVDRWDLDRFACGPLLEKEPDLGVRMEIVSVNGWKPLTGKRKPRNGEGYTATVNAKLHFIRCGRRARQGRSAVKEKTLYTIPVKAPARVILGDPVNTAEGSSPGNMQIRATFTIKGSQLEMTGDDAGELSIYAMCVGYTDFSGEARKHMKDLGGIDAGEMNLD